MSQQSVRQAARQSALNAQAVLCKQCADRERRLEALAVEVLAALSDQSLLQELLAIERQFVGAAEQPQERSWRPLSILSEYGDAH